TGSVPRGPCASASQDEPPRERTSAPGPETRDGRPPTRAYPGAVTSPATAPATPTTAQAAATPPPVPGGDHGLQYPQPTAQRARAFTVEQMLAKDPVAISLSGGPSSVYATGAPFVDPALFEAGVPVMGICDGFQAMAKALGGEVAQTGLREYGGTEVEVCAAGVLLDGTPTNQTTWMSHGDAVHRAPEGFEVLATSSGSPVAAFEDRERRLYGVQWHPEVKHSAHGQTVLEHFLYEGAGLAPDWTPGNVIADQVAAIRAQVGD